jgi:hypothetical protein
MATLKEFAESERTRLQVDHADAVADFAAARTHVDDTESSFRALTAELAELQDQIAQTHLAMSDESLLPADVEALAEVLDNQIIQLRQKRLALLDAERDWILAGKDAEAAQERLDAAASQLKAAEAEATAAATRADRLAEWKAAMAAEPLSTLASRANAALSTPPDNQAYLDAKARVEGDLPEKVRLRAAERGAAAAEQVVALETTADGAEDLLAAGRQSADGVSGKVAAQQIAFQRAEGDLAHHVLEGQRDLDRAAQLLQQVEDTPALTSDQRTRIFDAALLAPAEAAAEKESERDQARQEVEAKRRELEKKRREILAADITADPAADADVQTLEGELATLETDLADKQTLYDAVKGDLDAVEAAVPDAIWAAAAALAQAETILKELKDAQPGALTAALDAAEAALAAALADEVEARRELAYVEAELLSALDRRGVARDTMQRRVLSATRGDE